jgi:CRP/FNR family cyclic AMP-dependent transcriptional regulator
MARRKQPLTRVAEFLKTVPLFSACSRRELQTIAGISKEVEFDTGAVICEEGETGIGLHVIAAGEAKVLIKGRTRRRLGPGAFFGEIALLDGGPRTATVVAETPVVTLAIPEWDFRATLKSHPSLAVKMLEEICRRVRTYETSITN